MGKSKELAVVLVSGGMDSLVCAAEANEKHQELALLHLNYGQKTEKKELESFHKIADFYKVPASRRKIIDVTFLKQIGGSSLTDENISVKWFNFVQRANQSLTNKILFQTNSGYYGSKGSSGDT